MKKRYKILIFAFLIICVQFGGFLGLYLLEKGGQEIPISLPEIISSSLIGTIGGLGIFFFLSYYRKKKHGNIPTLDERTLLLFKRYFLLVLYIVLFGSSALLLILFALGVKTIEIEVLIVYMMFLFILIGLGALITKQL